MFEFLFNEYIPFTYPDIAEFVPSLEPLPPFEFNPVVQTTNELFTSPTPVQGIEFDISLARDAFQAGLQMQDVLQPLWD